jgi:hypothetical protein
MKSTATVKDRDAFFKFALQTRNLEVMDIKANKRVVKELQEKNGVAVPGVKFTEIISIGVRRGKDNG